MTGKRRGNPPVIGHIHRPSTKLLIWTSYRQTRQIVEKSPAGIRCHRRHHFPASGKNPKKRAWASSKNRSSARQQKTIEKVHETILILLHLRETIKRPGRPLGCSPLRSHRRSSSMRNLRRHRCPKAHILTNPQTKSRQFIFFYKKTAFL